MGFRFRKRLKLFPGIWINLSKLGGSLSVGSYGLTTSISRLGVPGRKTETFYWTLPESKSDRKKKKKKARAN
jgi:hypothetical protein